MKDQFKMSRRFKRALCVFVVGASLVAAFVGYINWLGSSKSAHDRMEIASAAGRYEAALVALEEYCWYAKLPGNGWDKYRQHRIDVRRAEILVQMGRGESELKALLKDDPDNATVLELRSALYLRKGDREAALLGMDRILELDPIATRIIKWKSRTLAQDDPLDAIEFLKQRIALLEESETPSSSPYDALTNCRIELAHTIRRAGQWDGIFELLNEADTSRTNPRYGIGLNGDDLLLYSRAALIEERFMIAEDAIERLTESPLGKDPFVVGLQGALLVHHQQPMEAVELLQTAIAANGNLEFVRSYLFRAYSDLGEDEKAADALTGTINAGLESAKSRDPFELLEKFVSRCEDEPGSESTALRLFEFYEDPNYSLALLFRWSERPELIRRSFRCLVRHIAANKNEVSSPFIVATWCLFPEADALLTRAMSSSNMITRARAKLTAGIRGIRLAEVAFSVQNDGLGAPDRVDSMRFTLTDDVRELLVKADSKKLLDTSLRNLTECLSPEFTDLPASGFSTIGESAAKHARFIRTCSIGCALKSISNEIGEEIVVPQDGDDNRVTIVHVAQFYEEFDDFEEQTTECSTLLGELSDNEAFGKSAFVAITTLSQKSYVNAWKVQRPRSFQYIADPEGKFNEGNPLQYSSLICIFSTEGQLVFRSSEWTASTVLAALEKLHDAK